MLKIEQEPRRLSGNRGRDNNTAAQNVHSPTEDYLPTPSKTAFVPPSSAVKHAPSIKEVIQSQPLTKPQHQEERQNTPSENIPDPIKDHKEEEKSLPKEPTPPPTPIPSATSSPVIEKQSSSNDFIEKWNLMVDTVFAEEPTLHAPLKHYSPTLQENVIKLSLKNDLQDNAFAMKKNEALRFMRENYDENINDIEAKVDEMMITKKFIMTTEDKIQVLKEQNADFDNFIKVLNLRVKD